MEHWKSPEAVPEVPGGPPEPIEARFRMADASESVALVPLPAFLDQVNTLTARLDAMAQRNETLALEVGQLRERTTQQATILGRVEAERDQLQARVAQMQLERASRVAAAQTFAATVAAPTLRRIAPEPSQAESPVTASSEPQWPVRRAWWRFWRAS
jgi:hypothetical protein